MPIVGSLEHSLALHRRRVNVMLAVDDGPVDIDVLDDVGIDARHGRVIAEHIALPVTAIISVTVVDTTIVADLRPPVALIVAILVLRVAPLSGCPEISRLRRLSPTSGDPEIAVLAPSPITGRPDVVGIRKLRLHIDLQRRRC